MYKYIYMKVYLCKIYKAYIINI